ncbi:MAG: hypothetical protein M4579_007330, partial [Chaenotheca gracillima]
MSTSFVARSQHRDGASSRQHHPPAPRQHQQERRKQQHRAHASSSRSPSPTEPSRPASSHPPPPPTASHSIGVDPTTTPDLSAQTPASTPAADLTSSDESLRSPLHPSRPDARVVKESSPSSTTPSSVSRTARRPKSKRAPPASWSSHGIETASGPPPALSFKRSLSSEAVRRAFTHLDQQTPPPPLPASTPDTDPDESMDEHARYQTYGVEPASARRYSRSTVDRNSRDINYSRPLRDMRERAGTHNNDYGEDLLEDDRDRTLRALEGPPDDAAAGVRYPEQDRSYHDQPQVDRSGSDDLFLSVAESTSNGPPPEEASRRSERRRSRIALASHRTSLPPAPFSSSTVTTSSTTPKSPVQSSRDRVAMPSRVEPADPEWSQMRSAQTTRHRSPTSSSLPVRRNGSSVTASAHPLDDARAERSRYLESVPRGSASAPRDTVKSMPSSKMSRYSGQRQSLPDASSINPYRSHQYRQSNLSYTFPQDQDQSPLLDRAAVALGESAAPTTPRVDGTESTVSTTAPSTVWDELDDLKSRIRKLELTGKLPSSSGAAMSHASGERPRTATTTVTTMSSSPKRGRLNSLSPTDSGIGGPGVAAAVAANLHPLLRTSLAKSKPLLEPDVYRALETTASDALSLTALMNGQSSAPSGAASVAGGNSPSDRQVRRKADSMCRSLTELCIALCDARTEISTPPTRRTSTVSPRRRGSMTAYTNDNTSESPHHQQHPPQHQFSSVDPTITTLARSSSRALSRVEARRSSLMALSSPQESASATTPTPNSPYTPANLTQNNLTHSNSTSASASASASNSRRLSRTSTVLFRNRADLSRSQPGPQEQDGSPSPPSGYRAPSRAATEINYPSTSKYSTASPREYIPNPAGPPARSPSAASTSLPLRRYQSQSQSQSQTQSPHYSPHHYHQYQSSPTISEQTPPVPPIPGDLSSLPRRYLDRSSPAAAVAQESPRTRATSLGPEGEKV